jgi:hypothetical protein
MGATHKEERPIRVPLPDVILGFAKGIEGMRKGEKRKIYIGFCKTQLSAEFLLNEKI